MTDKEQELLEQSDSVLELEQDSNKDLLSEFDFAQQSDSLIQEDADSHPDEVPEEKEKLILIDKNNKIQSIRSRFTGKSGKGKTKAALSRLGEFRQISISIKNSINRDSFQSLVKAIVDKKTYKEILHIALMNKKPVFFSLTLGIIAGVLLAYINSHSG